MWFKLIIAASIIVLTYADLNLNIQACKHLNRRYCHSDQSAHAPVMYMNDRTCTCSNTQIRNVGGDFLHFWGKHNSLPPVSVPYLYPETARTWRQHIGKHIPSHFYAAEKACYTAIQNHYALDVNKLKQRPVNTPALSESIICAVQWGMWIMAVK